MTAYEDDVVTLDDSGLTIRHHHRPGRSRFIPYTAIVRAEPIELRFGTGRFRLVGVSPGRPRHFFHWERGRSAKRQGVSIDTGGWWRQAITPDRPDDVLDLIRDRIAAG